MGKLIQLIFLCAVTIGLGQALAQETADIDQNSQSLSLFEGVEVDESGARGSNRGAREPRVTAAGPEFTLLGTSRIGGSYSAILRHRSGETILVKSLGNAATAIEGHAGYSVLSVGAGKLSLRYPVSVPCIENASQGVSCAAGPNTAELVLGISVPLSRTVPLATLGEERGATESTAVQSTNPFEAIRDSQVVGNNSAQNDSSSAERFVPKRISPEEVPPGMRVVNTPFGDRLVEQ